MNILIAPNALKDCLTAAAAAAAMARGVARAHPAARIVQLPVADGGEGLAEILCPILKGHMVARNVTGPDGAPVNASFCHVPDRRLAILEMASASGLALLSPERRDPLRTTTLGTGELIRAALDLDIARLLVGIGGSATNDGGIGMAAALGARFLDARGRPVEPVGGALTEIRRIDLAGLDPRLTGIRIEAACDVDNPLLGPMGAARIYGPQKGATPDQVERLEAGLARLAAAIERDLGLDIRHLPGAGAAGGLGAGLVAFLRASLGRGSALVLDLVGLDAHLAAADLVLTAEGRLDGQTASGKAPAAVAARALARGIPCVALVGGRGDGWELSLERGLTAVFTLSPGPVALDQALRTAEEDLERTAEQVTRLMLAARRRSP